jgi:tRNA(His) guanylyltransferase
LIVNYDTQRLMSKYTYQVHPIPNGLDKLIEKRNKQDVYIQSNIKSEDLMKKDSLGDRMKTYEGVSNFKLPRRMPLIIRLDGKAFHTFTRKFDRPFDTQLADVMAEVTKYLVENIQGAKVAYTQSDEISILLTDYDSLETDSWFDKKIQKICSVSASMATMRFMQLLNHGKIDPKKLTMAYVMFDSRVFVLPKEEVVNYFIWRQQDASRNSVQMLAQSKFSHKELQGKNNNKVQDMLMEKFNINWNDVETRFKRGSCSYKAAADGVQNDFEIPIFTQDREYLNKFIEVTNE